MTSAWPVVPVQTWRYVGLTTFPPEYPDSTFSTPFKSSKIGSIHQKQPPPRVTTSLPCRVLPAGLLGSLIVRSLSKVFENTRALSTKVGKHGSFMMNNVSLPR